MEKFKKDIGDREQMKRQIDKLQDQIMNLEEELDKAKSELESGAKALKAQGPGIPLIQQIKGPTEREAIN